MNDRREVVVERLKLNDISRAINSLTQFNSQPLSPSALEQFLGRPHNIFLSAEIDNQPVGLLIGYVLDRWDRERPKIFLYSLDVIESARRQGVASALILHLRQFGTAVHASGIFVLTNSTNQAAMALYISTGGRRSNLDDVMFEYDNYRR